MEQTYRGFSRSTSELRKFGLIVGGIFAGAFGVIFPYFRKVPGPSWPFVVAAFFLAPAILYPNALALPERLWNRIGHFLGAINGRLMMGVIFLVFFVPVGLVLRVLAKRNVLRLGFDSSLSTYLVPVEYDENDLIERMTKPY